ncbi:hypothetical protein G3578_01065 [Brevibacillus sp. SYP-B805]|uniref:hypothetical protein n=1 Tax=Brevibacillus sp. SYP-B805 TaxID=1578199 RepID=UPI0013EDE285|nr:hypothetical protein [Brevibacillus sp. SYP-B805]NGQ93759.1 hypothetical protein [Brevibacillus sp. SYP-B805]
MNKDEPARLNRAIGKKLVSEILPRILSDLKQKGKWPPAKQPFCKDDNDDLLPVPKIPKLD